MRGKREEYPKQDIFSRIRTFGAHAQKQLVHTEKRNIPKRKNCVLKRKNGETPTSKRPEMNNGPVMWCGHTILALLMVQAHAFSLIVSRAQKRALKSARNV